MKANDSLNGVAERFDILLASFFTAINQNTARCKLIVSFITASSILIYCILNLNRTQVNVSKRSATLGLFKQSLAFIFLLKFYFKISNKSHCFENETNLLQS